MLKLFEQKEKKKKLCLGSINLFQSTIKKECIEPLTTQENINNRKQVKFADLSNHPLIQNELILSKEQKEEQRFIGLMDKNFRDLISLRSFQSDHIRQKTKKMKSSNKLIDEVQQTPSRKKSCSLPRLKRSQSKISTLNNLKSNISIQNNSCHLLSQMIKKLEDSEILRSQEDCFLINKQNLQDLLNYLILLSRVDYKRNISQIIDKNQKFGDLKEVSEKIFYKLREKVYLKKRNTLAIHNAKIDFQFISSSSKLQRTKSQKHEKPKQQVLKHEKEEDIVSIKVIPTRKKLINRQEMTQIVDFDEKQGLMELDKIRKKYNEIQVDMEQYTNYLLSLDVQSKISQISALTNVQQTITKEMKQFYSTIINDPLLVPSLKEKLMINMISKILKNFKINTNDFSQMASQKSQSLKVFIKQIRDYVDKFYLKENYLVQLKKLFVLDTKMLLSKILDAEEVISSINRDDQKDIVLMKVAKSCRKIIIKYRNDPFFSIQGS